MNGSIFASALVKVIRANIHLMSGFSETYSLMFCNLGVMFFHMIPEVGSYFLAAIAGGVLSKAVLKEKFKSKRFYNVIKDSVILILLGVVVLLASALIESNISKKLFLSNVCIGNKVLIIIIGGLLIIGVIVLEMMRKKKIKNGG